MEQRRKAEDGKTAFGRTFVYPRNRTAVFGRSQSYIGVDKKYLSEGEDALVSRKGNPYAALHKCKSLSEIERLRLIVAKQEVEIARLKKGYWVEGVGASKEYIIGGAKSMKSSKNSK